MVASGFPIPSIQLDATIVGAEKCYDAWREAMRAVYEVSPTTDTHSASESIKAWLLKELIFLEVGFSAQKFSHDKQLASDSSFLSLQIYKSGSSTGTLSEKPWQISAGDVHIFDFSREFYSEATDATAVGVFIPHESIGYDPARYPGHVAFASDSPVGQFLANTTFSLLEQLPQVERDEAEDLSLSFCSLVEGVLKPQLPLRENEVTSKEERRKRMLLYLDRNLSDPKLSVDHLCKTFSLSRPSVYRDFADCGGVAHYIMQRRLKRAYFQLSSVPEGHRRIKEVAHGVGFNDAAHFSRLFRRRFGITPKEAANLNRFEQSAGKNGSGPKRPPNFGQLSEWIQSI